ncbi:hypothetical protein [Oceanobacillus rekensis]|uniref:hypothetical protein n=1 Tax=Oceanobacillus rekensis TaxID=937927 RepID=UPI00112492FD|nr:hypothetical protein [Oceanobacillus rekensis]
MKKMILKTPVPIKYLLSESDFNFRLFGGTIIIYVINKIEEDHIRNVTSRLGKILLADFF